MDAPVCLGCRERDQIIADLHSRLAQLEAQVERLTRQLEQAQRDGKRQAAPFAKGPPKQCPKKPGRKSGPDYGTKAHRPPPKPQQIDEVHEAALPEACPDCGGPLDETHVAHQYQVEIPRKPIHRQFNVHVGQCRRCHRRVQGRHPLQTSDALGAAAAQRGPDAQAAVVALNKEAGLVWPPKANAANERLAQHLWKHLEGLFTFLRHPGLDATNWRAELAMRFGVILRKVWGGNRTWPGARAQSVLMSVWRTCRQQGQRALDLLSQLLRGHPVALTLPP